FCLFDSFFFQAEDGIRYRNVTEFRRVLFRSPQPLCPSHWLAMAAPVCTPTSRYGRTENHSSTMRLATQGFPMSPATTSAVFSNKIGRASCREGVQETVRGVAVRR